MSDHADLLRRAATKARDTAQAATEGPWQAHDTHLDHGGHTATVLTKREVLTDTGLIGWMPTFSHQPWDEKTNAWANATHIALWHPGVALAVADWLESVSHGLPAFRSALTDPGWDVREDVEAPDEIVEKQYRHPLTVARALLNEPKEA